MEIQKVLSSNEATENESDFVVTEVRSSHSNSEEIKNWDRNVIAALELASRVNPFIPNLPIGSVIPTVDAVNWAGQGDVRPRLKDKSTASLG